MNIDMKHTFLSTVAALLLALLAWSCGNDLAPSVILDDAKELRITVGPRPAFAAGHAAPASAADVDAASSDAPATRAVQTTDAAQWETGDVLWLYVDFSWTPAGVPTPQTKGYVSALRYNGAAWLPLSEQDSLTLNTADIVAYTGPAPDPNNPQPVSHSGFIRHPRWPDGALAEGVTDAQVGVEAHYLGSGIPVGGVVLMGHQADKMFCNVTARIGTPVPPLNLWHKSARLHVTGKGELTLWDVSNLEQYDLVKRIPTTGTYKVITVPEGGGYYFVGVDANSKFRLDSHHYTLAPGHTDKSGNGIYNGYTYTLISLENGPLGPGGVK